jgi:hypothetical protein
LSVGRQRRVHNTAARFEGREEPDYERCQKGTYNHAQAEKSPFSNLTIGGWKIDSSRVIEVRIMKNAEKTAAFFIIPL